MVLLIKELKFSYKDILELSYSNLNSYTKRALDILEAKKEQLQEQ